MHITLFHDIEQVCLLYICLIPIGYFSYRKIHKEKKVHRDDSISFYVEDPDGNILQILWHPTLSNET